MPKNTEKLDYIKLPEGSVRTAFPAETATYEAAAAAVKEAAEALKAKVLGGLNRSGLIPAGKWAQVAFNYGVDKTAYAIIDEPSLKAKPGTAELDMAKFSGAPVAATAKPGKSK